MKNCLFRAMMVAAIIAAIATAQHNPQIAADGHPDLSGTWAGAGGLATALKRVVDEKVVISRPDLSRPPTPVSALSSSPAPSYEPQFQAKVKELSDHESKVGPVFYFVQARRSAHRRSTQDHSTAYEDVSGDPYRSSPPMGAGTA